MKNQKRTFYSKKKLRGLKRRCIEMRKNIVECTQDFPELEKNCWHLHAPVSSSLVDGYRTSNSIRRTFMQAMIEGAYHLYKIKPRLEVNTRVLIFFDIPYLFNTQIDVFFGDDYFSTFFDRNGDYQKWQPIETNRNITKEFNLKIPDEFKIRGYRETIVDDDQTFESEIWAIGEL